MLQEILLSLTGVSSPLWTQNNEKDHGIPEKVLKQVSLSEQAILGELAQLSRLHLAVKNALSSIQARSASPICLAVSAEISRTQLGAFRQKVLDVEESILAKDAAYVGGYDIVPLSSIVIAFAPWRRRLEWLRKIATYILQADTMRSKVGCSGASLLKFLELESHTGFSDVEEMALSLLRVAQETWMRSVASWVLYGQLPGFGHKDFMVQDPQPTDPGTCHLDPKIIPFFVTSKCAENILGIGNSLNQLRRRKGADGQQAFTYHALQLIPRHSEMLGSLTLPFNANRLAAIMEDLNRSVSQNALSQLLPVHEIYTVCQMIQSYLLLERGEFAIALISNMDQRLLERDRLQSVAQPVRKLGRLDSLALTDAELGGVLAKTWTDLSALQSEIETEDRAFMLAKEYLRLTLLKDTNLPDKDMLVSNLAPQPTLLRINIPVNSSLNIFMTHAEIAKYAHVNTHLLSIRKSQIRLSDLWKMTAHRRCHPTPLGPPASGTEFGKRAMLARRRRENQRSHLMRRHWSSLSKALFFVNEFLAYLHGEVLRNSWLQFDDWLSPHQQSTAVDLEEDQLAAASPVSKEENDRLGARTKHSFEQGTTHAVEPRDPRTMALAHKLYLDSLYSALLIDKQTLNQALNTFLSLIDHSAALLARLQTVWQGLDLQEDDGIMDVFMNYAKDEQDLLAEMDRSTTHLENSLQNIVQSVRDIEHELGINNVAVGMANLGVSTAADGAFLPWRARTLDRLIMKLDFLQIKQDEEEDLFYDAQAGSD